MFEYDLFVVHAEADAPFVHGHLLPTVGLLPERVLLSNTLALGASKVAEIERAVRTSRFTIVVLTPAYMADHWAEFGEQLASHSSTVEHRLIPLLHTDCEVPLRLDSLVALDFRDPTRWGDEAERLRARLEQPAPAAVALPCPYPGMRAYSADTAAHFHGRDEELGEILGRLRAGEREIYIVGPSGCGKSSLVVAGLLPRLARGVSGLGAFAVRTLRPGEHPTTRLGEVLEGDLASPSSPIEALLARCAPDSSLLLVIDQLEELFTLSGDDERVTFWATLRALRTEPRCVLVFTLRADFFGAFMESSLWEELRGRMLRVEIAPLRGAALREAIERPARELGVFFEPELVERLLGDAASEPGILPLLQETLIQLWDQRRLRLLTLTDYEALGEGRRSGLAVAISRRADATLRALTPTKEAIARRILLRLVSFGEGRSDTRRQQPLSGLRAAEDQAADFDAVVRCLVGNRLLTIDGNTDDEARVDLAHEVMITAWPTLAGWIQTLRADEQRRRLLEAVAAHWLERGRRASGLLDPIELAEAATWRRTELARDLGESPNVAALVAASKAMHEKHRKRRLAALSVAMLVIGAVISGVVLNVKSRRELESLVAGQVSAATTAQQAAQQIAEQGDATRHRAWGLFDAQHWVAGENVWTEVEALASHADQQYRLAESYLESALSLDPTRTSLRRSLADLAFERLLRAERDRRNDLVDELAARLSAYDDGRLRAELGTPAKLELEIVPGETRVWLERAGLPHQFVGQTPLAALTLPPGSIVLAFEAVGYVATRLPVRLAHGATLRVRIALPAVGLTLPGMIYVPPGSFLFGSADPSDLRRAFLNTVPIHEVSTAGYFISRYEVTFAEWIEFLDDLPPNERQRRSPQSDWLTVTEIGPRRWRFTMKLRAQTSIAETGQRLHYQHRTKRADQDWTKFPVSGVSYEDAVAFAQWVDRTRRMPGARLCDEYEWERAARGTDGRKFPTGATLDDANIDVTYGRDPLAYGPDEVGSHPGSRSPVGADDMAGNVWEITRSVQTTDVPVARGGGWYHGELSAETTNRTDIEPTQRHPLIGIRLCATPNSRPTGPLPGSTGVTDRRR